jgi:protein phosphatase
MFFGHIGDSRLYYLPHDGPMKQITDDHTYVGHLRRTGQANERQARTHPRKNVLNKSLGSRHQFVEPHVGAVGFEPGDRFLICSDGIVDGLWDRALEEHTRATDVQNAALHLVRTAIEEGSRDNCTALVIEVCATQE